MLMQGNFFCPYLQDLEVNTLLLVLQSRRLQSIVKE